MSTRVRFRHLSVVAALCCSLGVAALGVIVPPAGAALESQSESQPGSCTLQATAGTVTRTVDGRSYRLNVPAGLNGPHVPLVLGFHGAFSNGSQMESFSKLTPYAAERGFIVAYPEGSPEGTGYWQLGPSSVDVTYARKVVADIASDYCVDPAHVHATGWSRGAVMSLRLACDAADVFASVTMYAGSDPTLVDTGGPCTPTRPVAIGTFVGLLDPTAVTTIYARDRWVARNNCPATPRRELALIVAETYGPCDAGVEVTFRLYAQSHNWPIGADGRDILDRSWALFQRNPLP